VNARGTLVARADEDHVPARTPITGRVSARPDPTSRTGAPVLRGIVLQHVEEATHLWQLRRSMVVAPHVTLGALRRHDERVAAHLDGVFVAGAAGRELAEGFRDPARPEREFAGAVSAIRERDWDGFMGMLEDAQGGRPDALAVLAGALSWVSAAELKGFVVTLLQGSSLPARRLGLAACASHGVDPQGAIDAALTDEDPGLRKQALDLVVRLGRIDRLDECRALAAGTDATWVAGARAAILLGDRYDALDRLHRHAASSADCPASLRELVLRTLPMPDARTLLQTWRDTLGSHALIRAVGALGDPHYVPWLVEQMSDARLARVAGEAFVLVTGADLYSEPLRRAAPQSVGMEEKASDEETAERDADDDLPWPNVAAIREWWVAQASRFVAGRRYLVGAAIDETRTMEILVGGTQRQRGHAAEHRVLLRPGVTLFDISAPAWRQQRELGLR
jgi:uncharacterized protein (TIGR02270 family)